MFESAELGHAVPKAAYEKAAAKLRFELLAAQTTVRDKAEFPVILLLAGVDGAGTGDFANLLLEWIDPRHVRVHAPGPLTDDERARPPMWRFWRDLPPKGQMGLFFWGWYSKPIDDRVHRRIGRSEMARALAETVRFERMLVDEGALVIKVWLHLSKKAQRQRLEALESSRSTAWRVTKADWKQHARYDRAHDVCERALRDTSTAEAPWIVVEASDARYRNLTVGRELLTQLVARTQRGKKPAPVRAAPPPAPSIDKRNVVEELDLTKKLSAAQYGKRLPRQQGRLNELARDRRFRDLAVALVFEGNDAAGKGSTIRRVTAALDARRYRLVPIAAPTEEERAQPYLWRFWRNVPKKAHFAIFDRSWYGRVLVERVEGLASEADFMRAYREIVDFEEALARSRVVVVKFWLAIDPAEQLARFKAREKTPFKRFKITPDDWRSRKKWKAYEQAVCDMVDRTSTDLAPWHLVEANDKKFARVKVLETICDSIEHAMKHR